LVTILAEDQRQQRFARQYLKRLGYSTHEIYAAEFPEKGSGEQWVRLQYANNVELYRTQAGSPRSALVVMVDADTEVVARRNQQLNVALTRADSRARQANERIAHLITRRNVETWILCLNNRFPDGHPVNEDEDYKNHSAARKIDDLIKPAAEAFYDWSRLNAGVRDHCIPSLSTAILES
jgi:hypothetical protein